MPLNDCSLATTTETIDPTLTAGTITYAATGIASGGALVSAFSATWRTVTNPYFQGVQFDYGPSDGLTGRLVTAAQRQSPFTTASGIVGGKTYTIRSRAVGIAPVFGPWSAYVSLAVPVAVAPAPPQPGSAAWTAVGTTITGGGASFPAIHIAGAVDVATGVTDVIVEFAPHGTTSWTTFGDLPINTTGCDVTAVGATALYDIAISYSNLGTIGPRRILTNGGAGYTAGGFVGTGGADDPTPTAITWGNVSATGTGTQTATMAAQTFAGINVPITLKLSFTGSATWTYTKNGAVFAFVNNDTLVVSVGDSLAFTPSASATTSGTLTVTNVTDSNTVLSTPTYSLTISGADVSLNATSWADLTASGYSPYGAYDYNTAQTLSGINVPVTLSFTFTGSGAVLSYAKNGGTPVNFTSGATLSVVSGDTLSFSAFEGSVGSASGVVTVTNNTDASATVATFNYFLSVSGGTPP